MPTAIPVFPSFPQHLVTVTLGDSQFRLRLTYRERTASWYLDIYTLDGAALALGRRITPTWGPIVGLTVPGRPGGTLFVRGPDQYLREQLGLELQILHYAEDEIPPPAADDELLVIVGP